MIINIRNVWLSASKKHYKFMLHLFRIYYADSAKFVGPQTLTERKLESFIRAHQGEIMALAFRDFSSAINEFNNTFSVVEMPMVKDILGRYFNYDSFSNKTNWKSRPWSAYKLCLTSKYKICPYCHMEPIDTRVGVDSKGKSYRPQLDHYHSQTSAPFLALTLGNLIPACERCNGGAMKGTTNFQKIPHLNPVHHPETIIFSLVPRNGRFAQQMPRHSQFNLSIDKSSPLKAEAKNSLRTFQLLSRYQEIFLDEAISVAVRAKFESIRSKEYEQVLPDIDYRIEDTIGFNPYDDSYKNALGGKMKRDIFMQWQR